MYRGFECIGGLIASRFECIEVRMYRGLNVSGTENIGDLMFGKSKESGSKVYLHQCTRSRKYPGSKVPRFESAQVRKCPGSKVPRFKSTQVRKYPGSKVPRFESTLPYEKLSECIRVSVASAIESFK